MSPDPCCAHQKSCHFMISEGFGWEPIDILSHLSSALLTLEGRVMHLRLGNVTSLG
jgi:hypothetical protein